MGRGPHAEQVLMRSAFSYIPLSLATPLPLVWFGLLGRDRDSDSRCDQRSYAVTNNGHDAVSDVDTDLMRSVGKLPLQTRRDQARMFSTLNGRHVREPYFSLPRLSASSSFTDQHGLPALNRHDSRFSTAALSLSRFVHIARWSFLAAHQAIKRASPLPLPPTKL